MSAFSQPLISETVAYNSCLRTPTLNRKEPMETTWIQIKQLQDRKPVD